MAKLNVWVATPYVYEVDDDKMLELYKACVSGNARVLQSFRKEVEQTFGAGMFGEGEITGIYDDAGGVIGIG